MKMKKTLTAVVALALVAAVSVAGTMAFLTKKTGPVTNTFKAGSLGDNLGLELWENLVELDTKGQYVKKDATHVDGNAYEQLLPNSTNHKNPTVTVTKLTTDAYLFIEVVNDENDAIEATVNDQNWTLLKVKPTADNNTAKVYAYALNNGIVHATNELNVEVLTGNTFKVKDFTNETAKDQTFNDITVKAYICQAAGFADATEAWNGAFAPKQA